MLPKHFHIKYISSHFIDEKISDNLLTLSKKIELLEGRA